MKVFISWSGDTSHALALALRDWLPETLQSVEPWVSSEDIAKGAFWNPELVEALQQATFGLCCLTPDNVGSPWMAFEAGAMIQHQKKARVSPVLLGLKTTDAIGLYGSLQHTQLTLGDVTKLLQSINKAAENPIPDARVAGAAKRLWPELKKAADEILSKVKPADTAKAKRGTPEILEEVLEQLRSQSNQLTGLGISMLSRTGGGIASDPSFGRRAIFTPIQQGGLPGGGIQYFTPQSAFITAAPGTSLMDMPGGLMSALASAPEPVPASAAASTPAPASAPPAPAAAAAPARTRRRRGRFKMA